MARGLAQGLRVVGYSSADSTHPIVSVIHLHRSFGLGLGHLLEGVVTGLYHNMNQKAEPARTTKLNRSQSQL